VPLIAPFHQLLLELLPLILLTLKQFLLVMLALAPVPTSQGTLHRTKQL
jgi:hypothetical protein